MKIMDMMEIQEAIDVYKKNIIVENIGESIEKSGFNLGVAKVIQAVIVAEQLSIIAGKIDAFNCIIKRKRIG